MRFNIISRDGDGLGFGTRLLAEGNLVRAWIDTEAAHQCHDGLIPKVGLIQEMILDADPAHDVFLFDTSGDGLIADYLRGRGFGVLGACPIADRLERERQFGLDVMTAAGLQIPKSTNFTSFADAKRHVNKNKDKRMVYKPSNLLGLKSPAHVSYNADDLLRLLDSVEKDVPTFKPEFVLQEFVKGIPLSTEIWFDGNGIVKPLSNHTLERKELMNGNLGPSGGCSGNIVWACGDCPICEEMDKIVPFLKENQYHGPIDLNAIVTEDGIFGLEWTPRFGYDATPTALFGLLSGELGQFIADFSRRQHGYNSPEFVRETFAAGVRISIPPYPAEEHNAESGVPVFGLDSRTDAYLYNVKRAEDVPVDYVSAGAWGIIALLLGKGDTIAKALNKPYKALEDIKIKDMMYRTDLKDAFKDDYEEIESYVS